MSAADLLAGLVVFLAAPLSILVAFRLSRLTVKMPELPVLRERAISSVAWMVLVLVFAAVFINNGMHPPPMDLETTRVVTRGTLLGLSVLVAIRWLGLYRDER